MRGQGCSQGYGVETRLVSPPLRSTRSSSRRRNWDRWHGPLRVLCKHSLTTAACTGRVAEVGRRARPSSPSGTVKHCCSLRKMRTHCARATAAPGTILQYIPNDSNLCTTPHYHQRYLTHLDINSYSSKDRASYEHSLRASQNLSFVFQYSLSIMFADHGNALASPLYVS